MPTEPVRKPPIKIIVDSNALFVPIEFKLDIFTELQKLLNRNFELVLLSPVKRELETLTKKGSPKMRRTAVFALEMSAKCTNVQVPERSNEPTDQAIIHVAQAWRAPVFTNDKLLKRMLRDISIPVIYVRAKSRLEIDGLIS